MATHNDLGAWGEARAMDYLREKGYEIVGQNYRHQHAEIDLIAKKNKLLIFVEVKTRSGTGFGMPEEFVNYTKSRLILKAAEAYIFEHDWAFDVRFDIVSILQRPDKSYQLRHIEDAFY